MDLKSPVAKVRNEYLYSAGGVKLKVVQKWNPNYSTTPIIVLAINMSSLTEIKTTDYVGNMIYEDGVLKRILVDGGYIEDNQYHFYLADHLGNNRVVVKSDGTIIQKNHYYPFGMAFAETSITEQGKQPYKYNGKELDQMHGLNLYDYSARHYDGIRFTTIDPLVEKYYNISPYVYVGNNPLRFIDPTGMYREDAEDPYMKKPNDWEKTTLEKVREAKRAESERAMKTCGGVTISSNTDRYSFTGGDMTNKKNYVYRDHIDDGKKDIEVGLPACYVEAAAPKIQRWDGVAIGFEINFDATAGGGFSAKIANLVYILEGKDKGKWFYMPGFKFPVAGTVNYSFTGDVTFYSYTGKNIKHFSKRDIEGDMVTTNVSAGEVGVVSYTVANSRNTFSGGSVQAISLEGGLGMGSLITIMHGTIPTHHIPLTE